MKVTHWNLPAMPITTAKEWIIEMTGRSALLGFAALALLPSSAVNAQPVIDPATAAAEAPKGSAVIPVYGTGSPGRPSDEVVSKWMGKEVVVRNVTYPTLTMIAPAKGTANGTAVVVAPGGGFMMLAMQNEGWRVAKALADRGITVFVLKYRLNPTPPADADWYAGMKQMFVASQTKDGTAPKRPEIKDPGAGADGIASLKLIRSRAAEWGIDPKRVGMIGFSAGAMTALRAVLESGTDSDPQTRAPDFVGFIYGPMGKVEVPADAPPMFVALAIDDPLFGRGDFSIVTAWNSAKRPVELHAYQTGGHGFGLGTPGTTTTLMMTEFLAWLDMQGLLKAKAK